MFGIGRIFDKATGLEREHGPIVVNGFQLVCQVCRHDQFWQQQAQLHSPWATFLDVEFANRTANCAVCAFCGYVHWFLPIHFAPRPTEEEEAGDDPAEVGL